ncbi:hypothetical protein B9Z55_015046 [Caenorhabditis nigoni]|uniref:SUN domain-containing protein n=1 Tax=Caenorhabditis nigoni TaxID=1611254 RepID=A0A2G5U8G8_9PELO|nr:hypothetical protein B9Z55_015046 [Caenorhabditis nigoni]
MLPTTQKEASESLCPRHRKNTFDVEEPNTKTKICSSLNPIIGYDQTNLVLLDRSQPPADKAWCTNDKNPVLTINLAKYIKPISVSYQHSKWNETIPNGAPKTYDVVACLDFYCEKWTPLALNCEYSQYKTNETEQMCNISSHRDVPSIGKVQFRFRESYGNTKTTCVHLVRVYGETTTPAKIGEKSLKNEEICTDLRWYYHNSYFKYTWVNSRFGIMERKIESLASQKPNQDMNQFESTKPLEQTIADALKNIQFSTHESTGKKEPIIIPQINRSISNTEDSTLKVPIPNELFLFNAADFLKGASVDSVHSSSSSLNPLIGYDQSSLVLLDRPQPPADKAWCSNAENPVLTVNLASRYGSNEQLCNITSHLDDPLIGKVQFRFHENYGGSKTTCVHLVRVYGETTTPAKIEEMNLKSEEICTDLRWYYHNSNFRYTLVSGIQVYSD